MSNISIWPIDRIPIRYYHSKPEETWERCQLSDTPHSLKFQHYWNLTIRLFNIIPRALVWERILPLCRDAVGIFYSTSRLTLPFWVGVDLDIMSMKGYSTIPRSPDMDFFHQTQFNVITISPWPSHIYIYIYIYINMCVCVCVCVVR